MFSATRSSSPNDKSLNARLLPQSPALAAKVTCDKSTAVQFNVIAMTSANWTSSLLPILTTISALPALLALNFTVSLSPTPKPPMNVSAGSSVC